MRAKCRIRTRVGERLTDLSTLCGTLVSRELRVPTDSKQLSGFSSQSEDPLLSVSSAPFDIGLRRAFVGIPADLNLFPESAARREP
jgi:hypothetical protein